MNLKNSVVFCLALFAIGLCSSTVHGYGIANFTAVDGVVAEKASGSVVFLPPTNQDNQGQIILYVFNIKDILGLTSSQVLLDGQIVAELVPTNTQINNADYAGIITYSEGEDPNPFSDVEETTIDGVTVSQVKSPGYTGTNQVSSSINQDSLLGPLEGKTIDDLLAAFKTGNLSVIVRTEAYPDGELAGDIVSKDLPAPVKAEVAGSSSFMATMTTGVIAGITALFI